MPTYRCTVLRGGAGDARRAEIARAITRAHHEVTGAPAYFAQVIFDPLEPEALFIGGERTAHDHVFVHGLVRDGRSAAARLELVRRLVSDVAAAAGLGARLVWVYLDELPARHMAEFGEVLPEAGDEAAWAERLPRELRTFMEGHEGDP